MILIPNIKWVDGMYAVKKHAKKNATDRIYILDPISSFGGNKKFKDIKSGNTLKFNSNFYMPLWLQRDDIIVDTEFSDRRYKVISLVWNKWSERYFIKAYSYETENEAELEYSKTRYALEATGDDDE